MEKSEEGTGPQEDDNLGRDNCAICWDNEYPLIQMPCCDRDTSTIKYCRRCLEILCSQSQFGITRCPTCRSLVGWNDGVLVRREMPAIRQRCRMCCQEKVIAGQGMCQVCLYGNAHPLRYECNRCHRIQTIPHPMWRYQASPERFTTASWACHRGCGDYTFWRVVKEDIPLIPADDIPESWGMQDQALEAVRNIRRAEREA
jgi:hypothetical protein